MTKKIPLTTKLLIAFGVISLVTMIEALMVWRNVSTVDDKLHRIVDRLFPQTQRINELELTIIRASLETRHAMLVKTEAKREATFAEIGRLKARADELTAELRDQITTDEGRKRLAELERSKAAFWEIAVSAVPLIKAGEIDRAFELLESKIVPARNTFLAAIDHQQAWQDELLAKNSGDALTIGTRTEVMVLIVAAITALLGIVIALLFARHLRRQLGGEPDDAVDAVKAIAEGDLARPVPVRPGDQHSVMAALADMRSRLTALVSQVRLGVDNVATASSQIASGNSDLSGRTEQQASSLQETASSMQQMTTSVRANAENARAANQMAAGASDAAQRGGEVVGRVVSTMGEIQQSSQKIADIIGTIDGIAFQTNILALNAAVEAARAGEAGRGFAVVAAEVRSLASRSAEAAKEIKSLIGASVEKVDNGHKLVTEAGRSMEAIVNQVRKVTDLIGEITAASEEQTRGIDQVSSAVTQIDQGTQQNAALVEQSAAAAESLKQQAAQLSQAVSVFRIGTHDAAVRPQALAFAPAKPPSVQSAPASTGAAVRAAKAPAAGAATQPAATQPERLVAAAPQRTTATASTTTDDDWETF